MHESKIELPQPNDFRQPVLQQHNVIGGCGQSGRYKTIVVDPPWHYGMWGSGSEKGYGARGSE